MQKRRYSPEFKQGAVEQVKQPSISCAQVARELGIAANLLARCKREADQGGGCVFGGTGSPGDEEMAQLKRELARVKEERDFFAKRQRSLPGSRPEVPGDSALSQ